MYLSVLTLGEIQKGIERLDHGSKRRHELERWLVYSLMGEFRSRILTLEIETARLWGTLVASLLDRGRPAPVIGSLIAATARMHALTVVTRNERHFMEMGVPTLNPWS